MNKKLLDLTPKRYLCPFCGEWHDWEDADELGYYDSPSYKAELGCERQLSSINHREMHIYFSDGYCYYRTIPTCTRGGLDIDDKIPIEDIVESSKEPRVTFDVPFTAYRTVGRFECSDCNGRNSCLICKLGDENNSQHMRITFGFEFDQEDYEKFSKEAFFARKEKELQEHEQDINCKEKELQEREQDINRKERALKEREDAVGSKEQVSQRLQVKENKEDTTMANNIFNMNMEFGSNKDENIASTLMGVAVKNGDSWRIYDKKKKEITDVGDMQLGNLPVFILPTTKLSEGDLIKDGGEYYFVTKVATSKTPTQTLSARTGEMKSVVPIKNVLGFSCYSKVITLSDSLNIGEDFDVEKLAIMSEMCGQTGENGSQMNQLLPLMLFKDKLSGDDDMIKLLLMSSMMSGNMASSNNPLMGYLMLDSFTGKKDDKTPQTGDGTAE